jgi:energy-coupling factor transporter ATP-binding protein EcfA2
VHGARENNLKDVTVELPKRRLTVFTGVSGSGKSSLVFDTIAAESQRLINETYSAFVQGFRPRLSRPEVDVLGGLTTAIIVDQERMAPTPASQSAPPPTPTQCCASSSAGSGSRTSAPPTRTRSTPLGAGQRRDHRRARRQDDRHRARRIGCSLGQVSGTYFPLIPFAMPR